MERILFLEQKWLDMAHFSTEGRACSLFVRCFEEKGTESVLDPAKNRPLVGQA